MLVLAINKPKESLVIFMGLVFPSSYRVFSGTNRYGLKDPVPLKRITLNLAFHWSFGTVTLTGRVIQCFRQTTPTSDPALNSLTLNRRVT